MVNPELPKIDVGYVLDGLDGSFQPTVQLKIVDAGDLYFSWRWEHQLGTMRAYVVPHILVEEALWELALALPTPLEDESVAQALDRSIRHGPLTDLAREIELSEKLSGALFPYPLAAELNALVEREIRPHVRIQPSLSTAQVPWEGIRVDEGERFVHNSDVSVLPPATVRNARERTVSSWNPAGKVACVLDPVVPGFDDSSTLGSVLGPVKPGSALAQMITDLGGRADLGPMGAAADAFRRNDVTRDELQAMLASADRLLYVGHVTTAEHSLNARLHLSCGADQPGMAAALGAHRPLSAADVILGHRAGESGVWRMPNRVAFIACESGGEARFAEPVGLVAAAIHAGAQYVTATRWTIPTDHGFRQFAPAASAQTTVLPEAVVAVDRAHDSPKPVRALNTWQREQADQWEATGRIEHSPAVWAAFSTTFG